MIRIVILSQPSEYAKSIAVQESAWGHGEASTVPTHLLIAAQKHGGLVLGAYEKSRMVGILFGITALENGRPYHYSHITGVSRSYQRKGVGFKLKLAQRRHLLKRGQELVKWTYDPLQAGNAYFNIHKLGSTCRTYYRNLYGALDDSLNRGRLTDRFEVEWRIRSRRVRDALSGYSRIKSPNELIAEGAEPVNRTVEKMAGIRLPATARLGLRASLLLVEIPSNIVRVRDLSLAAASKWTLHVRRIFETYFRKGYVATDVFPDRDGRVFYLLESRQRT